MSGYGFENKGKQPLVIGQQALSFFNEDISNGGEIGIRTLGTIACTTVFELNKDRSQMRFLLDLYCLVLYEYFYRETTKEK